jgi:hypothetical protein
MVRDARIDIPQEPLEEFCRRWKITELALFGSVLRDDFRPDSDVDVLVSFAEDARWGLFDMGHMEEELRGLFGRRVDLITRRSVEESRNYIRRRDILDGLEVLIAAR